ncbi:hypothetical protein [Rhizobium sp. Leaf341]|uniref:hypothetical protein n=1 Tax=Rhizobium sp. Leaf341 TaxID=1736344 RepID=UPI0012E3DF91|nr:hypothetical protein [Rhizobium sp. Leaf341]
MDYDKIASLPPHKRILPFLIGMWPTVLLAAALAIPLLILSSCSTDRQWADVATVVQHTQPAR